MASGPPDPFDELDLDTWFPYDSGFSNPSGYLTDSGFGDPNLNGMYMSLGWGDPWVLGIDSFIVASAYSESGAYMQSGWTSPSRYTPPFEVSHEGGTLIRVTSPGIPWPDGIHRVRLIHLGTGQPYPYLHTGMNSGMFGSGADVWREPSGKELVAATPYAPVGTYQVEITLPDTSVILADTLINLVHTPGCDAMERMTTLPQGVYRPIVPRYRQHKNPWPANFIGGFLFAVSKELQFLHGVPETRLHADFSASDTQVFVISTHGFTETGILIIEDLEIEFTARHLTHFDVGNVPRVKSYPTGTIVRQKVSEIKPVRYVRGE